MATRSPRHALSPSPEIEGLEPTTAEMKKDLQRLHRKVARLSGENTSLRMKLNPPPSSNNLSLIRQGRGIKRCISMFEPVEELLAEGDRRSDKQEAADEYNLAADRLYRALTELNHMNPGLVAKLENADEDEYIFWLRELRHGADRARATDTFRMKNNILDFIAEEQGNAITPHLDHSSKHHRGLHHDTTARLLCPAIWDWDNISVRAKIRDGDPAYIVTAAYWPRLYYARYKCDLNDLEKGLFYSPILIKGYKLLFHAPSVANEYNIGPHPLIIPASASREQVAAPGLEEDYGPPPKRARRANTRRTVASLLKVHDVRPRQIAYVCVQESFALSSSPVWTDHLAAFDYVALYNNIVDYFERAPGPAAQARVDACLRWWNEQCYPNEPRVPDNAIEAPMDGGSVSRLEAQRRAKESAA